LDSQCGAPGTRFADKVAIVTGAGQGIGEAYAKGLVAEGARVVVADLNGPAHVEFRAALGLTL
jgi:NAD(P)-dependent dehydrogenase (short-subunit alcohol dehydrogenase family)